MAEAQQDAVRVRLSIEENGKERYASPAYASIVTQKNPTVTLVLRVKCTDATGIDFGIPLLKTSSVSVDGMRLTLATRARTIHVDGPVVPERFKKLAASVKDVWAKLRSPQGGLHAGDRDMLLSRFPAFPGTLRDPWATAEKKSEAKASKTFKMHSGKPKMRMRGSSSVQSRRLVNALSALTPEKKRAPSFPVQRASVQTPTAYSAGRSMLSARSVMSMNAVISAIQRSPTQTAYTSAVSTHVRRPASASAGASAAKGELAGGMRNLGNTCYMNAVLQALLGLPSFVRDVLSPSWSETVRTGELELSQALLKLVREAQATRTSVDPRQLKTVFDKYAKHMAGHAQEDAHEFLATFLALLNSEMAAHTGVDGNDETIATSAFPVRRNFNCFVRHRWTCTSCGEGSSTTEAYRDFSLAFDDEPHDFPSLQSLFEANFAPETVERTCESCGAAEARVEHHIVEHPRVLVLHLKRFRMVGDSIDKRLDPVVITECLDVGSVSVPHDADASPTVHAPVKPHASASSSASSTSSARVADGTSRCLAFDVSGDEARQARGARDAKSAATPAANVELSLDDLIAAPTTREEESAQLRQVMTASARSAAREEEELKRALQASLDDVTPKRRKVIDVDSGDIVDLFATAKDQTPVAAPARRPATVKYRLHAIINHKGRTPFSGHYVTDVFSPTSGSWRSFNDSRVSNLHRDEVFGQMSDRPTRGYIYFFAKE